MPFMLRLVVPKGSLEEQTLRLLEAADLPVRRASDRDYHGTVDDPRIDRVSILRPQEIPRYVEEGFFDLGITGRDWVEETEADVEILTELSYSGRAGGGVVRIVLAVPGDSPIDRADQMPADSKISTEYPGVTQRAFEKLGIPVRIFTSYGATEAKVPEIVDAIVELTETGSTLRRHGMKVIETFLESQTVIIANRDAAADPAKRQAMEDLKTLLLGALAARGKVLVKLNVSEGSLLVLYSD
jgi:ATP phosphoribosyltransferase